MSKVQQAIRLVEEEGLGVNEAAERLGVSRQSIYSAIQRREFNRLKLQAQGKKECPCCGGSGAVDADWDPGKG